MRLIIFSLFTTACLTTEATTQDTEPEIESEDYDSEKTEEYEEEFEGDEEEFEGDEEEFEGDEEYEEDEDGGVETDAEEGSVTNSDPISSLSPGVNEFTLEQVVAGELVERRFLVHTPDNFTNSQNIPLLFSFHGNGGTAEITLGESLQAVEEGYFIGVYPSGLEYSWNLGPEESEADDVAFVDAILGMLTGTAGVDASNPVAMGFSNGAGMVHELAMESQNFVAIAAATSHMLATKTPDSGAANVSVLQFSGTEDSIVPYQGGIGVLGHNFLHAEDSTAEWGAHNGCAANPTTSPDIDGPEVEVAPNQYSSSSYTMLQWENCSTGAEVVHVRMNNIGHDLPYDMIDGGSMTYIYNFLSQARQ